jgi:hypothetical protein
LAVDHFTGSMDFETWGIMSEALQTANRSRRTTTVDALMYPPLGVGKRACSTATLKSRYLRTRRRTGRQTSTLNTGRLFPGYSGTVHAARRRLFEIRQLG